MADQKRWFKVWTSIVSDDDFDSSRVGCLADVGRFALLGAYTALHGNHGTVTILPDSLFRLMQLQSLDDVRRISTLKNVVFEEGKNRYGKVTVTWLKWRKYQEDSTVPQRMKSLRDKRRGEEKRIDREKRREVVTGPEPAENPALALPLTGDNTLPVWFRHCLKASRNFGILAEGHAPFWKAMSTAYDPYEWLKWDEEVTRADAWIEANPQRRPRQVARFLRNWFERAVERKRRQYAQTKGT